MIAKNFLEIEALNKFKNSKHLLKDVNMHIPNGDFHVLIGSNGAGKTTLIRTILGIYQEWYGKLEINGIPSSEYLIKNKISFMREGYHFPSHLNVKEFLLWNSRLAGIDERKAIAQIYKYAEKFKLLNHLNMNPNNLSSGQKQIILLIKLIIEDANLIIMDEPTSNLDPEYRILFFEELKQINKLKHKTILICTHQLDEIDEKVDSLTMIKNGAIVYSGKKNSNIKLIDIFKKYY